MRCVISLSASATLATLAVFAPGLMGCGRNATREDCELIVNRNVEVQLKAMGLSDQPTIEKRTGELRTQMKPDIDECVAQNRWRRT